MSCTSFNNSAFLQKLEAEAQELCEEATTGQYLIPDNNPTDMLSQLKKVCVRVSLGDVN